jgi:uncharacterized membrane protein YhaH (DUF805 family)
MFKKPFSFEGRIRRTEFGLSYIFYIVFLTIADIIVAYIVPDETAASGIGFLFFIPAIWFIIAQGAKRCHDRSASAWFQLIPFYFLWMLFADSVLGPNEYGDNPKGIGNFDEIETIGEHLK